MPSAVTAADHVGSVPVVSISCPDDTDDVVADDVRVPIAALLANDALLTANSALYVLKSGSTSTGLQIFAAGATVSSGQDLTLNGVSVQGVVGFSTLGRAWFAGRKQLWRARVTLSDADHTVDVDDGDRFNVPTSPGAPRVITLDSTVIVPTGGETLTFYWNPGTGGGAGTQYTFKRGDATIIAKFDGTSAADAGAIFAEFEFVSGTGWRLGNHSGTPNEYTAGPDTWTSYGVTPGPSA